MKKTPAIAATLALIVFAWYLVADRYTPFTSNARVKAIVVPLVPEVSGYIVGVSVTNSQMVKQGEPLAIIDPRPYQIRVDKANADLELATNQVGADSAEVEKARAAVTRRQSEVEIIQLQSTRIFELEKKGLIAITKADNARSAIASAESNLIEAKAELVRAQEESGSDGEDNPAIRSAVATLAEAELDLERTRLLAPTKGVIIDLNINEGTYANVGKPLLTFVSTEEVWIEAYLTENNLGRISLGDPVEVVLDIHPGRVLSGVVESAGGAASNGRDTALGELPKPPTSSGWMRDPQRFPVRIRLPDYTVGDLEDGVNFQVNGQADVIVYTSDSWFLNAVGAFWIRAMAWLSYAY